MENDVKLVRMNVDDREIPLCNWADSTEPRSSAGISHTWCITCIVFIIRAVLSDVSSDISHIPAAVATPTPNAVTYTTRVNRYRWNQRKHDVIPHVVCCQSVHPDLVWILLFLNNNNKKKKKKN